MEDRNRRHRIEQHIRQDPFAARLGATVEQIQPGHSRVSLRVTGDMNNFHGMTHGGVVFSLADIAFAAASNSHGQTALALHVNLSFLRASKPGDQLTAEAKEQHLGGRTALYDLTVTDEGTGELVARGQGTVYRKREWFVPEE